MAISRRLRFEILRRDGHACRYCGAMAPDVKLTVDHVVPTTLGGSDDPTNLVTACAPCNAGKSSISPDSGMVEDVAADALRWARAMETAATAMLIERDLVTEMTDRFKAKWNAWSWTRDIPMPDIPVPLTGDPLIDNWCRMNAAILGYHARPISFQNGVLTIQVHKGWLTEVRRALKPAYFAESFKEAIGSAFESIVIADGWDGELPRPTRQPPGQEEVHVPLPADWRDSIERFISVGLPEDEMYRLITVTMERQGVYDSDKFGYFCGCCWRAITDLQEDARRILESET